MHSARFLFLYKSTCLIFLFVCFLSYCWPCWLALRKVGRTLFVELWWPWLKKTASKLIGNCLHRLTCSSGWLVTDWVCCTIEMLSRQLWPLWTCLIPHFWMCCTFSDFFLFLERNLSNYTSISFLRWLVWQRPEDNSDPFDPKGIHCLFYCDASFLFIHLFLHIINVSLSHRIFIFRNLACE